MPMTVTSGTSGGNVGENLVAAAGLGVQAHNPLTQDANMSVDNVGNYNNITTTNAAATATTATSITSSEISGILNASDAVMQAKIDTIIHDPNFPAVLLRMDRLLRGGIASGNGISSKKR
ncbi:hypothetical protein BGX24_007574 [Mortierella sp. AD032]|nr:hypothetical protein BGX24_007574 [Mortierella sp. AD032]